MDDLALRALTDRDALEELLADQLEPEIARELAQVHAAPGLFLRSPGPDEARPGSRLGGPALLPPGEPRPEGHGGTPLSFLAGIDLAELPELPIGLPRSGWLLVFVASEDLDGQESFNEDDEPFRLLYTEHDPVSAPDDADVLRERRVVAQRVLTLPYDRDGGVLDELGVEDDEVLESVIERLDAALDPTWQARLQTTLDQRLAGIDAGRLAWELDENDGHTLLGPHWIGGCATGAQGFAPEPGTDLLLHVASDDQLGFAILDAGIVQIRIPREALLARDWSQAVATADGS